MNRSPDISAGAATIVRHMDGGWAVPGGGVVHTFDEAQQIASAMGSAMAGTMAQGGRQIENVVKPPSMTVRNACPVDGPRWRP